MMRITPLAVWASGLNDPALIRKAVVAEVEHTHPHKLVHDAIFIYCMAIRFLLSNQGQAQEAFEHAY